MNYQHKDKYQVGLSIAQSLVYSEGTNYNSPLFKDLLLEKVKLIFSMPPFVEGDFDYVVEYYDLKEYDHTKFNADGSLQKTK